MSLIILSGFGLILISLLQKKYISINGGAILSQERKDFDKNDMFFCVQSTIEKSCESVVSLIHLATNVKVKLLFSQKIIFCVISVIIYF